MKIAVIADIHGNAPALEAVLSDLGQYHVNQVIDLGDAFNGPIDPVGVAGLLRGRTIVHISGNGERMVLSESDADRSRSANFARSRLNAEDLAWIRTWPHLHQGADFLACHGSPDSDVEYLLEEVVVGGAFSRSPADIAGRLGSRRSSLVLCAHTHVPRFVQVDPGTWILNPGSVGLPAYSDASPVSHKMEVGSPHARYAIVERVSFGWKVSHIAVPYDHEKAAIKAEREGFSDWASAIRTGYEPRGNLA